MGYNLPHQFGELIRNLIERVPNSDKAVEFYTKMFGTGPAKTRPGYANFAIAA